MGNDRLLDFLRQVRILQDLTPAQISVVRDLAVTQKFPAGTAIVTEGEPGDCLFLLIEGVVEISKTLAMKTAHGEFSQKDKTLDRMAAEQHPFFGEVGLFTTDVRTATVTAVTDCTTLRLCRDNLRVLEREHPAVAYALVRRVAEVLCERMHRQNQDILKLTTALSIALSR